MSGQDLDGIYRRIRFAAENKSEAIRTAKEILRNPSYNQPEEFPILHIADALFRAARERQWKEAHRKNDALNCDLFLRWVDSKGIRYWHELRYEHIEEYQSMLANRGLAFDTIRLYLWPVRRTARWVASNWPNHYTNFCDHLRLTRRLSGSVEYREEVGNPVLTIPEVLDLLEWVSRNPTWNKLAGSIALQALVGLRIQESLRLSWQKVDFLRGTIIVDGIVKNVFSARCLPLPNVVHWLLRRQYETTQDPALDDLITPGYSDYRCYSKALKKMLERWNPAVRIKPKDLRNTLPTAAMDGGWHSVYVERYLGHSPQSITERHYHGD